MSVIKDFLQSIIKDREIDFHKSHTILSFSQYLDEVVKRPHVHLRTSAQYFADMIESFGSYEVKTPAESLTRYRLFDAELSDFEGKIFGQERVQHAIVSHIKNFARCGKVDKLILLHGPNGSSKTSIVQALGRALERYSQSDEGVLYQFSWVFPKKEELSGHIGFHKTNFEKADSYALLPNDQIDAQLSSDHGDHPLLLLSLLERKKLFTLLAENSPSPLNISEILKNGEMSQRNRQIFDALLSSCNGNLRELFRHVRVERFYFSRRYKKGIAVVEPQLSVDANLRQISSDQSLYSLPAALRHLSLFEAFGPLADANRGLIEYSDLLKRPLDAWKYLLVACEQAQVSVAGLSLFLDLLMIATSNELHLSSFKEYPDWQSFKGRIELVRVPYLLRSHDEVGIYMNQLPQALKYIHKAPHALELLSRWAVLTRLEAPDPDKYRAEMREIVQELSPDEKLDLFNDGEAPLRLNQRQARELEALIPDLVSEYENEADYEGRYGASAREIRMLLLNASQDRRYDHLSVPAVFEQIEQLIEQKSSFEFLRREPKRGFRDPHYLLDCVKLRYGKILEEEARSAIGLFDRESYLELFRRYISHVSAWTKKERFMEQSGRSVAPDEAFMQKMEERFMTRNESKDEFRRQLISQIGAYKLEHPNSDLDYPVIFSSHMRRLKESIYAEQQHVIYRIISLFLGLEEDRKNELDEKDYQLARALKDGLLKIGYNNSSARLAMAFLMAQKSPREDAQFKLQNELKFR
jgi:serine protein kinase